jgi:hypothetical protein
MNTTRTAIAAALTTVTGVKGYAWRPRAFKAGDAWPLLGETSRGPGRSWQVDWKVFVVLGNDEKAAADKADALLPDLCAALDPVAFVDTATPITITTDAGELYALELRARSE